MKKFNSIISILLATVLLLTMIPMTVIAEDAHATILPGNLSFPFGTPVVEEDGEFGNAWKITGNTDLSVSLQSGKVYKFKYDFRLASGGTGLQVHKDWNGYLPSVTIEPGDQYTNNEVKYPNSTYLNWITGFRTGYVTAEYTMNLNNGSTSLKFTTADGTVLAEKEDMLTSSVIPNYITIRAWNGTTYFKNVSLEEIKASELIKEKTLLDITFEDGKSQVGTYKKAYGVEPGGVEADAGYSKALKLTTDSHYNFSFSEPVTSGKVLVSMDFRVECHSNQLQVFPQFSDSAHTNIWAGGSVLGQIQSMGTGIYLGSDWLSDMIGKAGYSNMTYILDLSADTIEIYYDGIYKGQKALSDTTDFKNLVFRVCAGNNGTDSGPAEYWLDNMYAKTIGGNFVLASNPKNNEKIEAASNVTFTFYEDINVTEADFEVKNITDGIDVTDFKVASSGKTATISFDKAPAKTYSVTAKAGIEGTTLCGMKNDYTTTFTVAIPESKVLLDLNFEEEDTQIGGRQDVYGLTNDTVEVDPKGSTALKVVQGNNNDQQFAFVFGTPADSGKVLISMDYRFENHSSWFHSFAGLYASNGSFWDGGALKYNEVYRNQLFIGSVGAQKGAGVLDENGNDSYNNLKMLVDLDKDILRVYHDGVGAVWYDADEKSYTEYSIDNQENLGKLLFKYGTNTTDSGFHGRDSENPENSVYWFDNIKAVTVPTIQYIGGTYENGSEKLALTKGLKEEFNFTEDISAEYFDENGKLLPENANLFILEKNGAVLPASEYSVSLIDGKKLVVDSEVKPGDSFEFTMKKEVKVSGLEQLKEDFVHSVTFDSAPVSVMLTTAEGVTDELTAGVETTVTAELNVEDYTVIVATYKNETLLESVTMFNEGEEISVKVTPDENTILKIFIMHDDNILTPFVNAIVK